MQTLYEIPLRNERPDLIKSGKSDTLFLDSLYNTFAKNLLNIVESEDNEFKEVLNMIHVVISELRLTKGYKLSGMKLGGYYKYKRTKQVDVIMLFNESDSAMRDFIRKARREMMQMAGVTLLDTSCRSFLISVEDTVVDLITMPAQKMDKYNNLSTGSVENQNFTNSAREFARIWNQCCYIDGYIPGRLTTIEYLALEAVAYVAKAGQQSFLRVIHKFFELVNDYSYYYQSIQESLEEKCFLIQEDNNSIERVIFVRPLIAAKYSLTKSNIEEAVKLQRKAFDGRRSTCNGLLRKIILNDPNKASLKKLWSSFSPTRIFFAQIAFGLQYKNILVEFRKGVLNLQANYYNHADVVKKPSDCTRISLYISCLSRMVELIGVDFESRKELEYFKGNVPKKNSVITAMNKMFKNRKERKQSNSKLPSLRRKFVDTSFWHAHHRVQLEDGHLHVYITW